MYSCIGFIVHGVLTHFDVNISDPTSSLLAILLVGAWITVVGGSFNAGDLCVATHAKNPPIRGWDAHACEARQGAKPSGRSYRWSVASSALATE